MPVVLWLGEHHSGELRRETADAKAERLISEELRQLGWKEADLVARRKSDPTKLAIAARLRTETTLPMDTSNLDCLCRLHRLDPQAKEPVCD
jgi:hypothetical protein